MRHGRPKSHPTRHCVGGGGGDWLRCLPLSPAACVAALHVQARQLTTSSLEFLCGAHVSHSVESIAIRITIVVAVAILIFVIL